MTPDVTQPTAGSEAPTSQVPAEDKRKWTVMVFMGADTVAGTRPMFDAAAADLREMQAVGSGDRLNIFVQIHGTPIPQRCHVGKPLHDVPQGPSRELSGGLALGAFISWALSEAKHDPDDPGHYSMLVMWGHAYEFAIGHAVSSDGTIEALDFTELSRLLARLQGQFGHGQVARKLDILGFDACDLSTVEIACQLSPFAKYLLGSEIGIPIPGWPYYEVLRRLRNPIGDLMGPAEFGAWAVRRYCESYTALRTVSLTLLDLERVPELLRHGAELARALNYALDFGAETQEWIAYLFSQSQTVKEKPYVDVADLCLNLCRQSDDPLLIAAARSLGDFLISPRPEVVGGSAEGLGKPFILEHGRNASETARINGVGIYAPHVLPGYNFDAIQYRYEQLAFSQNTGWSGMVHRLARR